MIEEFGIPAPDSGVRHRNIECGQEPGIFQKRVIMVSPRDLLAVTIFDKRYGRAVKGIRRRHNPKQRVDSLISRSGRARVAAHDFCFI